jgi:hypothetical protein
MQPGNLPGGKLSHLDRRLRQLWQRVVHDDARIADGEDPLLTDDSVSSLISIRPPGRSAVPNPHSRIAGHPLPR